MTFEMSILVDIPKCQVKLTLRMDGSGDSVAPSHRRPIGPARELHFRHSRSSEGHRSGRAGAARSRSAGHGRRYPLFGDLHRNRKTVLVRPDAALSPAWDIRSFPATRPRARSSKPAATASFSPRRHGLRSRRQLLRGGPKGLFGGATNRLVTAADRAVRIDPSMGPEGALLALAATARHAIAGINTTLPDLIVGHGVFGRLLARLTIAAGGRADGVGNQPRPHERARRVTRSSIPMRTSAATSLDLRRLGCPAFSTP
jgi:hypothetical protein